MTFDKLDLQPKHGNLDKENFNSSESTGSNVFQKVLSINTVGVTLCKYQVVSLTVRLESLAWQEDVNSKLRATKKNLC